MTNDFWREYGNKTKNYSDLLVGTHWKEQNWVFTNPRACGLAEGPEAKINSRPAQSVSCEWGDLRVRMGAGLEAMWQVGSSALGTNLLDLGTVERRPLSAWRALSCPVNTVFCPLPQNYPHGTSPFSWQIRMKPLPFHKLSLLRETLHLRALQFHSLK